MAAFLLIFICFSVLFAFWRGLNLVLDLIEKARADLRNGAEAQIPPEGTVN